MSRPAARARDVESFIAERRHRWAQLEAMLDRLDAEPLAGGRARILELMRLYRLACSDLNQARSFTANPELLGRLNQLVGRAYRFVYQAAPMQARGGAVRRFLTTDAPLAFQRQARWLAAAALAMALGALFGFAAVLVDVGNAEALIPREFFTASPSDRVETIETREERIDSVADAAEFGSQLYTHNIQVSFLAFAAGAATVIGAVWLLFYNGAILGAVAAMYLLDGVGTFFIAWVGPHGALELPAIIFGAAAGMRLGGAALFPGVAGRAQALRESAPDACRILLTAALVLVAAGLIEGSFSQFSAKTVPYGVKIAVAVALFAGLCAWLLTPRGPGRTDAALTTEPTP